MPTRTHHRDKTGVRPRYTLLGTDEHGSTHLYNTHDDQVIVITAANTLEQRVALDGRSVDEWMAYVDDARGWLDRRYHATLVDALASRITLEADDA